MKAAIRPKTNSFVDFDSFRLDRAERFLLVHGQPVPLTPKAFDTLVVLLENSGHVVEKDEFLKKVWPDTFVEEGTLAQNISTLRKVLGTAPDGRAYIETIPRRGYRFSAAVREIDSEKDLDEHAPVVPAVHLPLAKKKYSLILVLSCVSLGVLLTAFFARKRIWPPPASPAQRKITLAVLPFTNLTGEPQQEYFSDGFTEEMITQLSQVNPGRLGVIARTSAMQYKNTNKRVDQIGRELGVDYVLEGSVRREGNRVRISAQLVRVRDQTDVWARSYERDQHNLLSLENDVANAIGLQVVVNLAPQYLTHLAITRPIDPEAYELYLKGRYFWNKRGEDAYLKAIEYFDQAIVRDPVYARAYAGLADAYALLGSMSNAEIPRSEAMPKAKAMALKAIELDDTLAEAHTSLAFVKMHYEWDWPGAEKEFQRALALNSNYATAHQWYAYWFVARQEIDKALEQMDLAQKADPLSVIIKADTSEMLLYAGRIDQAEQQIQRALELDPEFALAHIALAKVYESKKDYQEAIAELQKAVALTDGGDWALSELAVGYALAGQRKKSTGILQKMLKKAKNRDDLAIEIAAIYADSGSTDQAFIWLEKAFRNRVGGLILLNSLPEYQSMRRDPRFAELDRRIGLPDIGEKLRAPAEILQGGM